MKRFTTVRLVSAFSSSFSPHRSVDAALVSRFGSATPSSAAASHDGGSLPSGVAVPAKASDEIGDMAQTLRKISPIPELYPLAARSSQRGPYSRSSWTVTSRPSGRTWVVIRPGCGG
eukprot:CAMPEP_0197194422 /NCGR_PEP_ID=MMETSP1423-20130617/29203_1 /TAXON_ID=476441 /ORGANISM="Pseudo-nitzschia heimii, Strain UNC1101" /LENGTH=116 /DNA_ID=CAMNT_0042647841 /DNA_START=248 /DNA_END=595 /DNA_ORIENTATION=-